MRRWMTTALAALAMGVAAVPGAAQETSTGSGRAEMRAGRPLGRGGRLGRPALPANPDTMSVQQVEQYFDQVVLYQAQSQLRLTDAQSRRFGAALRGLQAVRRQQQRQRLAVVRDLTALLSASPLDEAAVTAKTREFDDLAFAFARQLQDAQASVDAVLDVGQRARFRVFEEMMERRKLDLLMRARRGAGSPAAPAVPQN